MACRVMSHRHATLFAMTSALPPDPDDLTEDAEIFPRLAEQLLYRHGRSSEHEDNLKMAVRDFIVGTGLAEPYEIVAEGAPARLSRRRVDLVLSDVFIEVKSSLLTAERAWRLAPKHIKQIDDYIEASPDVSLGVLTDGRHWLLRSSATPPNPMTPPWMFQLTSADQGLELYRWLQSEVLANAYSKPVDLSTIGDELGLYSTIFGKCYPQIVALYEEHQHSENAKLKRDLWELLLVVALGEVTRTVYGEWVHTKGAKLDGLDDLFVRHTYLSIMIGLITQASYGVDIVGLAATNPEDLVRGREFREASGISGIIESDFFSWVAEVPKGTRVIAEFAARVARYDWKRAEPGLASVLYQSIIPSEERAKLGEYYTPSWLAEAIVDEVVTEPLSQRVLDPACGSGQFLVAAINRIGDASAEAGLSAPETLDLLQNNVMGIDLHPVAVHLAKTEWALAARPYVMNQSSTRIVPPVFLGDSLQLMTTNEALFSESRVVVPISVDPLRREMVFPRSLVDDSARFDESVATLTDSIQSGISISDALSKCDLVDSELDDMQHTVKVLHDLHSEGRDHIWSYFARNIVRPVAIAKQKTDVIVGNPPWINYNQTSALLRNGLRDLSVSHGIWDGGRYATHGDVAGLFFARCMSLYLEEGGECAMVLPHSALLSGHYKKWRSGRWASPQDSAQVDLSQRIPWDLEQLDPNDFFPVPSCVVFGRRTDHSQAASLPDERVIWLGTPGSGDMAKQREQHRLRTMFASPYADVARQGATIMPRCLFFVEVSERESVVDFVDRTRVHPYRSNQEKQPWRDLDIGKIFDRTVHNDHLYMVLLGESIAPFVLLDPRLAVLPALNYEIQLSEGTPGGVSYAAMRDAFMDRWDWASKYWEQNKGAHDKKNLVEQLDYMGKLSSQLTWFKNREKSSSVRVVYSKAGIPTAAVVTEPLYIIDHTLYWMPCEGMDEAYYLSGIINSPVLLELVRPLMPKGQFGPRDLHKHLWKLSIPKYDSSVRDHRRVVDAARAAAHGVEELMAPEFARNRGRSPTTTKARSLARKWLAESPEGRAVDEAVAILLG